MLYGYIKEASGSVIIDPEQARKIEQLFSRFADGETLTYCCEGLPFASQTCKKMLSNRSYLGEKGYPQIIEQPLFSRVASELVRRKDLRKPKTQPNRIQVVPVRLHFTVRSDVHAGLSPQQMYEMVVPVTPSSAATAQNNS